MQAKKHPLTVRLLGFSIMEGSNLGTTLTHAPRPGPSYFCLLGDSLQEPDITIANGDDLKALATLVASEQSPLRPALIVGTPLADVTFPVLPRPLEPRNLFKLLTELVRKRSEALDELKPGSTPAFIERRRRIRLDLDMTDPAEFRRLRQQAPEGAVLIVDKRDALRDHVAKLLAPYPHVAVEWTDSAPGALKLCEETAVSVVIINTSTPSIDPYELCQSIKRQPGGERIAVVLLVNQAFGYDTMRARAAGVRGMLDKPVADRHLLAALRKLMSLPS